MHPRYQVFLSSTFRDLREERQAVLEAILELGHFPAGMEAFPAADATPWELIRSIIADSDYYVLIVGGKYGSTGPAGISYTEMEFDLAIELKKPVLAFLHSAPDQIPVGKAELNQEARQRLEAFRTKVSERLCKGWLTKDELKAAVLLGLVHLIRTKPAYGWVRNEGLQNQELLQRLATLQSRYDQLEAETKELRANAGHSVFTDQFQSLESLFAMRFEINREIHTVELSWSDIFFGIADEMLVPCAEYRLLEVLRPVVVGGLREDLIAQLTRFYGTRDKGEILRQLIRDIRVEGDSLTTVLRQLMAKGLLEPQMVLRQGGDQTRSFTTSQRCWVLTPSGKSKYLENRAFKQ